MEFENYSSKVGEIKVKLQKLVYLHRTTLEKNKKLEEENKQHKTELETLQAKVRDLNDKIKIIQISGGSTRSEDETKQLKQKINGLIREVDKCISLLNA